MQTNGFNHKFLSSLMREYNKLYANALRQFNIPIVDFFYVRKRLLLDLLYIKWRDKLGF
jgi:hypothetical protein